MRCFLAICIVLWSFGARAQTEAILDLGHLPPMKPSGPEGYRDRFLMGNLPRAWAIASDGSQGGQWGAGTIEKAREAALKSCAGKGGTDCAIYAENLDVVWRGRVPAARPAPATLIADRGYAFVPDARFFWRGARMARGVVVWGHGYGGAYDDERGRQPPAFLRALNNAGFDVVRFDRDPNWDQDIEQVAGWLRAGLVELRRQGWRVVVAGGQSRGGWTSLEMLRTPGVADAVVTTSAAASGQDPGNQILRGETMMYSLLSDVPKQPTRVVYIQFKEDPFGGDEDKRARRMREMVGPNVGALLLIDRPDGFKGHMGAFATGFAEKFGACIARFVMGASQSTLCDGNP